MMSDVDCCGCFGSRQRSSDDYRYTPSENKRILESGTDDIARGRIVLEDAGKFDTPRGVEDTRYVTFPDDSADRPAIYQELPQGEDIIPWDDPDFQTPSSIVLQQKTFTRVEWIRPRDISGQFGRKPQFLVKDATRYDINQGELGDCWYLTSLACITSSHDRSILEKCMPFDQNFGPQYSGQFRFRFWNFGEWVQVLIDDRLPTIRDENGYRRLIFARNDSQSDEYWVPLIEKAFVKLRGGLYSNIEVGNANTALVCFTGGVSFNYFLKQTVPPLDPNLYNVLYYSLNSKSGLASCITPAFVGQTGLVPQHVYCISGAAMVPLHGRTHSLLRLLNPWGRTEWTGRWSDNSTEFSAVKTQFQLTSKDDGEFWMSFEDFVNNFDYACICFPEPPARDEQTVNNMSWKETKYVGRWFGSSAAGSDPNERQFWSNPQYRFAVSSPANLGTGSRPLCHVVVSLMQRTVRNTDNIQLSFYILKVPDQMISSSALIDGRNCEWIKCPLFCADTEVANMFELTPGCYVVIPCTYQTGVEAKFLLRIYTEAPVETRRLDVPSVSTRSATGASLSPTSLQRQDPVSYLFKKYSGGDDQMDCDEFATALNEIFQNDGIAKYNSDTARSLLVMLDATRSCLLDIDQFGIVVQQIFLWKEKFYAHCDKMTKRFHTDHLKSVFPGIASALNDRVNQVIRLRYATTTGDDGAAQLTLDNFIHCCCRIVCMLGEFDRFSKNGLNGLAQLSLDEWLSTTILY